MIGVDYFSKSYEQARYRFIAAACAAGAQMDELHLDVKGPNGVPLAIEIAWLGIENPSRVVIHSSGIHGVEGFAGSAVQLALLESGLDVPADAALILVHCLNPYGMAWLRRANEHNVDINRNFILDETTRTGADATYRELDGLLNPVQLPPGPDLFFVRSRSGDGHPSALRKLSDLRQQRLRAKHTRTLECAASLTTRSGTNRRRMKRLRD